MILCTGSQRFNMSQISRCLKVFKIMTTYSSSPSSAFGLKFNIIRLNILLLILMSKLKECTLIAQVRIEHTLAMFYILLLSFY